MAEQGAQDPSAAASEAVAEFVKSAYSANPLERAAVAVKEATALAGALQELPGDPLDANTATFYSTHLQQALREPAPTPAQLEQGRRENWQALIDQHGEPGAAKLLELAREEVRVLSATNPKLPAILDRTGAGNSAWLIARLAERAVKRAQRQALKGFKR